MNRRSLLAATVVALPAGVAAQTTLTHLRIVSATVGESFMEGAYARDGGFLRTAGFDVETIEFGNGGNATTALLAGAVDLAVSNVGSLAAAYVRGLPLCAIAPSAVFVANPRPTTALIVPKDSPIRSARDLAGKTVSLSTLKDLQHAAILTWLEKNGADPKSVGFVEVTNAQQPMALATHRVDATMAVEPFVTTTRDVNRILGVPYEALGARVTTTVWLANRTWVANNLPLVRRFVAAIRATAQWADSSRRETGVLLAKFTKLAPETIEIMGRATYGETLDAATIQPVIDATAKYGFLSHAFPATEMFATGL